MGRTENSKDSEPHPSPDVTQRYSTSPSKPLFDIFMVCFLLVVGLFDVYYLNFVILPLCLGAQEAIEPSSGQGDVRPPQNNSGSESGPLAQVDTGSAETPPEENQEASRPDAASEGSIEDSDERTNGDTQSDNFAEEALPDLYFETGRSDLSQESERLLDRVFMAMKKRPSHQILFRGHADERGERLKNIQLSWERARSAANYMMKKGISANRLTLEGVGEKIPATTGTTDDELSKNRRVEVYWR